MKNRIGLFSVVLLTAVTTATAAHAHNGTGLGAGFLHPLSGLDHLLALLAVGIWAGRSGAKAIRTIPACFIAFMAAGAALALTGIAVPGIETAIFASVAIFALLAAVAVRLPMGTTIGLTGAFAMFHGAAHSAAAGGAMPISFIAGFVAASVALIAVGVVAGTGLERFRAGRRAAASN